MGKGYITREYKDGKCEDCYNGKFNNGCKDIEVVEKKKKKIMSKESRLRMSLAHTGKKLSPEHRHNMSLAQKGKILGSYPLSRRIAISEGVKKWYAGKNLC